MSSDGKKVSGCILLLWGLLVTAPMWLVLLFALMQANEMPTWAWVLYWCYILCSLLGLIIKMNTGFMIVRQLFED